MDIGYGVGKRLSSHPLSPERGQAEPRGQDPGKPRRDATCLQNGPHAAAAAARTLTGADLALR